MQRFRFLTFFLITLAISLQAYGEVELKVESISPVNCGGGSDGSITVSVTGGRGKYSYLLIRATDVAGAFGPTTASTHTFSGLIRSAAYLVLVSDEYESTDYVMVEVPGPDRLMLTSVRATDITCNGYDNGNIRAEASGEDGNYIFELAGPDPQINNTGIFTELVPGDYTVTARHATCPTTDMSPLLTISEPPAIAVTVDQTTDVECYGDSTGVIRITATGGSGTLLYQWTGPGGFSSSSEDLFNLAAGTYHLEISDSRGCLSEFQDLATIQSNTAISGSFALSHIGCTGAADGAISASIEGGSPGYDYAWEGPNSFTAITKDISGLLAGTYILKVTDALGCEQFMPNQVLTEPEAITASVVVSHITCHGERNGAIELSPAGGTGDYSYDWTGPDGYKSKKQSLSNLLPGSYSVTITDDNDCIEVFTDIANVEESPEIQVNSSKTNVSCHGQDDGSIQITVSGGQAPYSFDWSGPGGFTSENQNLAGLAPGAYHLSVTDTLDCSVDFHPLEQIQEPDPISATYVSHADVSCNGASTGSIIVDVSGGVAPLSFNWTDASGNTLSTEEDPSALPAGSYTLTITDAGPCVAVFPNLAVIIEPDAIITSLDKTDLSCHGTDDGSITVDAAGGVGPYVYSRLGDADPNYQSSNFFDRLEPGLHTIWIRDDSLCVVTDTITLIEPEEIEILQETLSGTILCHGNATGSISIDQVSGGVLPLEYSINNGINFYSQSTFTNLPAGQYQTVVRDASDCSARGALHVITQPEKLRIFSYEQENITTCFDAPEGSITIKGAGGSGTRTYVLNANQSNQSGIFENLVAGTYEVSIMDQNACSVDTTVEITAPTAIVVDLLALTNIHGCAGASNGEIHIEGSGGDGNIQYSLNGGSYQTDGTYPGLMAGMHRLTLRDGQNCTLDSTVYLSEPAPLLIDSEMLTPITCEGEADGSIEIRMSGGTDPLSFTLNPGGVTNSAGIFSGLGPGDYTVSVNDAENCGPVVSSQLSLVDPPPFNLDSVEEQNISCYDEGDGFLHIHVSGGVPPYSYSVDNQATWSSDAVFSTLVPDDYEVYARDAGLCTVYAGSFSMSNPPQLSLSMGITHITGCAGDLTGEILASGTGGTGLLQYSLNGTDFQESGHFTELQAGAYTVFLMDEWACTMDESVQITEPDPVSALISKTDATYGNLGSITISQPGGGTAPYQYSIEGPDGSFSNQTEYTGLEAGSYPVVVRDAQGCTYEEMVHILDVLPLEVVIQLDHVRCFGADDGVIEFQPQDAEGAVQYSIDGGQTFGPDARFENLPGNTTYYLVAEDAAGKVFIDSVFLEEPTEITASWNITPAECNAFSETGAIDVTLSGGAGGYTYQWSDGSTEEDRTDISAGVYTLESTDLNQCSRSDVFLVGSLVSVYAYAGADTTICQGSSVQLTGLGGHTPSWSPADFLSDPNIANPVVEGLTRSTSYALTISEEISPYGCFNLDTVNVFIFPQGGLIASEDTFILRGSSLQLEAEGDMLGDWHWEPAESLNNAFIPNPVATPLESTLYTVQAVTEYGCEESDSIFVEVIEDLRVYNVFTPNGDGINEYFEIEQAYRFPEILVEIYSRWGDMLFQSKGYGDDERWDGRSRGKDVPLGTYYYVIIPFDGATPITGNVTIIR